MSFEALSWAAKQRPGNLAAKMVLLGLANYADEHGCAYPSTAALAEFGDMDHKTATAALDRLVGMGLIVDTGARAGRTKQIKVYRLELQSIPKPEASPERKPSAFPQKAPQKRGTDTVRDTGSVAKATSPRAGAGKNRKAAKPDDVTDQTWQDFNALRERKRAPLSPTALTGIMREAEKAGWSLERALVESIERGWQAFKAEWVKGREGQSYGQDPPSMMAAMRRERELNSGTSR